MANQKISQMPSLTASELAAGDLLAVVDVSDVTQASSGSNKKITVTDLQSAAVSAGTANGVLYLNGSKVATSGSALTFDGSNLGFGGAPKAWLFNRRTLEVSGQPAAALALNGTVGVAEIFANAYYDTSSVFRYATDGAAGMVSFNNTPGSWIFATAPYGTAGGAISFTQAMTLDASGNLLVGTTSANANLAKGLQIASTNWGSAVSVTATASAGTCAAWGRSSDGNVAQIYRDTTFTTIVGSISVTASATAYNTSSDYRLKNITGPITTSGAYIDSLNPVEGTWKADGSTFVGLIAHEVQEVSRTQVATGEKDGEQMQAMDYSNSELIANLIAEVKSLRVRVAALESN